MNDVFLLIDKPAGMSSFGVVARVRRVLSEKAGHKIKVGHTGTLDPFATGLLILLIGKGTKRSNEFLKLDKWYETTICLGKVSTTGDPEGEVTVFDECNFRRRVLAARLHGRSALNLGSSLRNATKINSSSSSEVSEWSQRQIINSQDATETPSLEDVQKVVAGFVGETEQRVPNFSAVKINGERAYKLARKGMKVEMPTRKVQIFQIDILGYKWPELKIRCHVSSGTYIRTLGEDIGEKLGVGGYLTELRRTKVGEYDVKDATKLDDFMNQT